MGIQKIDDTRRFGGRRSTGRMDERAARILAMEDRTARRSDAELGATTDELRRRLADGASRNHAGDVT